MNIVKKNQNVLATIIKKTATNNDHKTPQIITKNCFIIKLLLLLLSLYMTLTRGMMLVLIILVDYKYSG